MFFGFIIPLWLTEGLKEYFGKVKPFDPEQIRSKLLTEQEGVEVIFSQPKGHGPFVHDSHGHNHGHH
jgi:hypothetical protein